MNQSTNAVSLRLQLSGREPPKTNNCWSVLMDSPIPGDDGAIPDEGDALEVARVQMTEAIVAAHSSINVLVIQCQSSTIRFGLGEHLSYQASHALHSARSYASSSSSSVDAYLDLFGYPQKPARCIVRGMTGYWSDIAAGLPNALDKATVLAIDSVEHMLDVMPMRLTRFIQSCVANQILVVILSSSASSLLKLDLGDVTVRSDYIMESEASEHLKGEALGEALAAIACASGKRPSEAGGAKS